MLGLIALRVGGVEHFERLERLLTSVVQKTVGGGRVLRLERGLNRLALAARANAELRDPIHRQGRRPAAERSWQLLGERHRTERRRVFNLSGLQVAVEPAIPRTLDAGRPAFHVVLRVEVRSRAVVRPAGVNDRELPSIVHRLERRQSRMKPEEAVEVEGGVVGRPRLGDRDARPGRVIRPLAKGDDHVQSIDGAPLEDGNQHLAPASTSGGRARQEGRGEPEADQRQAAIPEKHAA